MTTKRILLFVFMLCSITIVNAQTSSNTEPTILEMSGEIISKVKLAKDYYMTSTDVEAGNTFDDRTVRLSLKVKEIFKEYTAIRTEQNKRDLQKKNNSNAIINEELKHIRQSLHYMNLPTDL